MICCEYRHFVYLVFVAMPANTQTSVELGINLEFKLIHFNHSSWSSVGKLFFYHLAILN